MRGPEKNDAFRKQRRSLRGTGTGVMTGQSFDVERALLERLMQIEREKILREAQHGTVKVLWKDGKPVSPLT